MGLPLRMGPLTVTVGAQGVEGRLSHVDDTWHLAAAARHYWDGRDEAGVLVRYRF